jgi:hypothetical protein
MEVSLEHYPFGTAPWESFKLQTPSTREYPNTKHQMAALVLERFL